MINAKTVFGTFHGLAVDKQNHAVLITASIPIRDGGAVLDELAAFHGGIGSAPIAIAMQVGRTAAVLKSCLAPEEPGDEGGN